MGEMERYVKAEIQMEIFSPSFFFFILCFLLAYCLFRASQVLFLLFVWFVFVSNPWGRLNCFS